MIVKIEKKDNLNNCHGYYYFECEEIEYWATDMKDAKSYNFDGCMWIVGRDHENRDQLHTKIIFLFNSNRSQMTKVITTRDVYIMNNNGKTIDMLLV